MNTPETTPDAFDAVRTWADELLGRAHAAGPIPTAGSAPWSRLDDEDPRKAAAVVRAALVWLYQGTREAITARLAAELNQLDHARAELATAIAQDLADTADWSRVAAGPTQWELIRRRTTQPCPDCRTALAWTTTTCGTCGWTEPTPTEIRAAAHASWAHYDHTETAA